MVWQVLFNGLVSGSVYALMALGYTLIYGVARLINFAHGDIATVGAYTFLVLLTRGRVGNLPSLLGAGVVCVVAALGVERIAYRPASRAGFRLAPVISTLGASAVLQAAMALVFGPESKAYPATRLTEGVSMGAVTATPVQLATLVATVLLTAALLLSLRTTRCGQALRAVADDPDLAQAVGINPIRVVQVAFILSGALAACAGVAAAFDASVRPGMSYAIGFPGFTAAVLGGIGNPAGAILGAYLMGISQDLAAGYVSSKWKIAYAFIVLIAVLLVRPQGILRGRRLGAE